MADFENTSLILSEQVKTKIIQVFKDKGLKDIKIDFEAGSKPGDGYAAVVIRADLVGEKDGCIKKYDLIIKTAPSKLESRKTLPLTLAYNRENLFYTKIAPIFNKIEDEYNLPKEKKIIIPKCYGCSNEYGSEFIIFNNLKALGYTMIKHPTTDYAHTEITYRNLGKLHALAIIFEMRYSKDFNDLKPQLTDILYESTEEFDSSGVHYYSNETYQKILKCIHKYENKSKLEKAIGMDLGKKLAELSSGGNKKLIMHGDCWYNNMLFKYQDDVPIEQIPLDYQVVRYGSMANDMLMFMGVASDAEVRHRFWELVDVYYQSLSDQLSLLNYDVNKFCTREELVQEVKDQSVFAVAMKLFGLPFLTSDEILNAPDMMGKKIPESFYKITDKFVDIVNNAVDDFVKLEFI